MRLSAIVCCGLHGVIGYQDGRLAFRCPKDMQFFKSTTKGAAVIMGRKTWETLPKRKLDGRLNIVLTRQKLDSQDPDLVFVSTVDAAIRYAESRGYEDCYVIGGAETYQLFQSHLDRVLISYVYSHEPLGEGLVTLNRSKAAPQEPSHRNSSGLVKIPIPNLTAGMYMDRRIDTDWTVEGHPNAGVIIYCFVRG